jgi:hypothetical protein
LTAPYKVHTLRCASSLVVETYDIDAALKTETIELVQTIGTLSEQVLNVWYQPCWNAAEVASWRYNSCTTSLELGQLLCHHIAEHSPCNNSTSRDLYRISPRLVAVAF